MPMAAPPTLQKPVWKDVIPPARMQIMDIVNAKLANGPIARGGAGWSPMGGGNAEAGKGLLACPVAERRLF